MKETINLDEILEKEFKNDLDEDLKNHIKSAMVEGIKQSLSLAANKTKLEFTTNGEFGPPTLLKEPKINKESILNIINLIK
jgi:hypothetical protein